MTTTALPCVRVKFRLIGFCIFVLVLLTACSPRRQQFQAPQPTPGMDSVAEAEDLRLCAAQLYEEDQLDSALDLFTRATILNPADPRVWHGKGAALSRLLRHDEAQEAFNEALRLKPDYVAAIWHRACDHSANLHREAALSDLRLAITLDSTIKQSAKQDRCYQWLWNDKEFLEIVD